MVPSGGGRAGSRSEKGLAGAGSQRRRQRYASPSITPSTAAQVSTLAERDRLSGPSTPPLLPAVTATPLATLRRSVLRGTLLRSVANRTLIHSTSSMTASGRLLISSK